MKSDDNSELDQMQSAYKAAVEEWIAAIKREEALASVNHSIAEVDKWEDARFKEDEARRGVEISRCRGVFCLDPIIGRSQRTLARDQIDPTSRGWPPAHGGVLTRGARIQFSDRLIS